MTVEEMKTWIDNASYEQLLSKWRFAEIGNPYFDNRNDGIGDYYAAKMKEKRAMVGNGEHVRASKAIGWER